MDRNERWSFRNMVLVGDALHTAHFSIGSGTRLALEDVIALVKALESARGDLASALALYKTFADPSSRTRARLKGERSSGQEHFPRQCGSRRSILR